MMYGPGQTDLIIEKQRKGREREDKQRYIEQDIQIKRRRVTLQNTNVERKIHIDTERQREMQTEMKTTKEKRRRYNSNICV